MIPLPQGSIAAGLGYWLSLARTQGKEWLSLTILAERSSVLLFALITDESPVWPLLTGRLPNSFWILARLFPYNKSGKPLCVPVALYNLFLFLSTTSKVTCGRHKHLNYVIEKMQWESSGQLKIWTYVNSQDPPGMWGICTHCTARGGHVVYRKTWGFLPFPLLLWWHRKDSGPLPGTLGEPGADCSPKSSKL